jgi:hypothetical protein
MEVYLSAFISSALGACEWSASRPGRFTPRERAFVTLGIVGGWVVPGSTQPLTEMSSRNLPAGKGRPARKADNLTAICEPNV